MYHLIKRRKQHITGLLIRHYIILITLIKNLITATYFNIGRKL